MSDRFHVVTLTGYAEIGRSVSTTDAYVLDAAYGFQVVGTYHEEDQRYPGGPWATKAERTAGVLARATARAAELNAEHEAWLAEAVA